MKKKKKENRKYWQNINSNEFGIFVFSLFFPFLKKKILILITFRFITLVTRFNFPFEKHGERRNFNF